MLQTEKNSNVLEIQSNAHIINSNLVKIFLLKQMNVDIQAKPMRWDVATGSAINETNLFTL